MAKTAVFRVDASPTIGGGHVMRCLALADRLAEGGWRCRLAVGGETTGMLVARRGTDHDVLVLEPGCESDPAALAEDRADGVDWLIVDHYGLGMEFEAACRPWARRILVIDDLADRRHECDLLVDQTLGRRGDDYFGLVPEDCDVLLGPAYALLGPAFAAVRPGALARRAKRDPVRRLLVAMGLGDSIEATSLAVEGIARSGLDAAINVVVGIPAPGLAGLRERLEHLPQEVEVHVATQRMAELMVSADVALASAGTSTWERCCLGLPSLVMVLAENQRRIAESVVSAGAAHSLGSGHDVEADEIASALNGLAGDGTRRQAMSAAAAEVCDGRGVARVVEGMAA